MLTMIAAAFGSRAGGWLAAGLAALALPAAWRVDHALQARRLAQAVAGRAAVAADLVRCRTNVSGLEAAVKGQNAAVLRVAADGRALQARAQAGVRAVRRERDAAAARARQILAARASGDRCAAADRLILEGVR